MHNTFIAESRKGNLILFQRVGRKLTPLYALKRQVRARLSRAGRVPGRMGRLETEFLAGDDNLPAPADLSGQWIDRGHARHPPRAIVLDTDSMAIRQFGDPSQSRRDPSAKHCLPSDPTRRPPTRSYDPHPCRLQPSGRIMGQEAPGRRQGRTASGRTCPARWLHRHQAEPPCRARGRLLQPARRGRAAHRGRQERDCAHPAVMPEVPEQCRAAPASCARLQSR